MDSTEDDGRLKSLLLQLQTESNILDRMVYKNKNQHRRCNYFQSLLKVRRDVRLLLSARLEDVLTCASQVINGRNPAQRIHLLERLKSRTLSGTSNFYERLLGAARLLSQMVEPVLRAATQISSLLAKSFFMGFSLTILSLLARLRVLVQQMLVECVSMFNKVTSLSQERHSVKLTKNSIEAFREYYPPCGPVISLECAWERDKFVLLERQHFNKTEEKDLSVVSFEEKVPEMQYDVLMLGSEGNNASDLLDPEDITTQPHGLSLCEVDSQKAEITQASNSRLIDASGRKRKVAFVSVTPSSESPKKVPKLDNVESCSIGTSDTKDPFLSLLTAGNVKSSLFEL